MLNHSLMMKKPVLNYPILILLVKENKLNIVTILSKLQITKSQMI